ncbi:Rib/alpha/Esp surface antigen-like repeat protein, partial [Streptococcus gallinaceus]
MFREHSNREKQQQRFGFRKYKAGVSSVLLAVAFLGAVLPSFVAPMATIVYAGTRIPGSKAELNDAAAKSVDLANIANFDFTSLLIVESGYHAKLNYVKVGTTYGTPENNFSEITGAKATGTAMVNFVIIDDNTGQPYTKQDGQVDFVSPSILITNTPAPKPATPQPEVKENTVPEKTPVAGQPVSVVPKDPNTTIVTPNPVNGLTVDSDGHLTGTPTVDDWQPGEESRKITIPVTVTGQDKTPVTVEVPVTITRVTPTTEGITVPQGTPITEKDVTDKVTVPAGGKITTIGEIPSTDTAGDKPAVEVIITYPNGDTETVEVPVKVTPKVPTT